MPTSKQLRNGIARLVAKADTDLDVLWRRATTADQMRDLLLEVLPPLTEAYNAAAATLATEWYDAHRAEKRVKKPFVAALAEPKDLGAEELARFGVGPLYSATPDWQGARGLILGGLQRRIADGSRLTIVQSSLEDPSCDGWQRNGSGECDWCTMLINRGPVYSEASVDFAAHDNCRCDAEPAFGGMPRPVKPYESPITEVSAGDREPPDDSPKVSADDKPLTPMERMARALSPAELRMETKRGSANAQRAARAELARRAA